MAGSGPAAVTATEPRTVTASIMVPPAAFTPAYDGIDYSINGTYIYLGAGSGTFTAPLAFPVPVVSIKRITLYAYDNGASIVCATLYRSRPSTGAEDPSDTLCAVDSTDSPQTVYTTEISPRQVNTASHGSYLRVAIGAPGLRFYGVKVTYSYSPGAVAMETRGSGIEPGRPVEVGVHGLPADLAASDF